MDIVISGISWCSTVVAATEKMVFITDYKGTVTYVSAEETRAELERIYDLCTAATGKCCEGDTSPCRGKVGAAPHKAAKTAKPVKGKSQRKKRGE